MTMTIGIALLILWVLKIIIRFSICVDSDIKKLKYGCMTSIMQLTHMGLYVWMIIRFWNTPF